ncbi:hypothetical protein Daesc_007942 [Daldinia eschscholtzii]|uniref:Uncharacterized protein n=1 Tax=Daldinia eschscholtzii TaxID=292717 RepID=A0AAX6MG56_9PEZI
MVLAECNEPTTTISTSAGATGLSKCRHFQGSVRIADNVDDDEIAYEGPRDTLDLETIGGDLVVENVDCLCSLTGDKLKRIGGTLRLHNATILSTLKFPQLTDVGSIDWLALPFLAGFTFSNNNVSIGKNGYISISNTFLALVDKFNYTSVRDVVVAHNNQRLGHLDMPLINVTGGIVIENNYNPRVSLPNTKHAGNLSVGNVLSFEVPSLTAVTGSVLFNGNQLASIYAPAMATVSEGLTFINNGELSNLSFPALTSVGSQFTMGNNTKLQLIKFPNLTSIGGDVDIRGSFTV